MVRINIYTVTKGIIVANDEVCSRNAVWTFQ